MEVETSPCAEERVGGLRLRTERRKKALITRSTKLGAGASSGIGGTSVITA